MTRHTRNRQVELLKGIDYRDPFTLPITDMIDILKEKGYIDPTFEWHRNFKGWGDDEKSGTYNMIEFGGDEYKYGTRFKPKTKEW